MARAFAFVGFAIFAIGVSTIARADQPATSPMATTIRVDKEHDAVLILIEGKEVGRFDKDGLHITGNVDFTGVITDKNGPASAKTGADHAE